MVCGKQTGCSSRTSAGGILDLSGIGIFHRLHNIDRPLHGIHHRPRGHEHLCLCLGGGSGAEAGYCILAVVISCRQADCLWPFDGGGCICEHGNL